MGFAIISSPRGYSSSFKRAVDIAEEHGVPAINTYVLGDLIDLGKDSKEVIGHCIDKEIKVIKGNHEKAMCDAMLNYLSDGCLDSFSKWIAMGGKETIESYGIDFSNLSFNKILSFNNTELATLFQEHILYLMKLPACIELNDFYLIHGGIPRLKDFEECEEDDFLEKKILNWNVPKRQITSSIAVDSVDVRTKHININKKNHISVLFVPGMKVVSLPYE